MDVELEEIKNQHFGRTPCNTPFASQQSCSSDSESEDHLEMCRFQAALLEFQAEVSDDEDLSSMANDSDLPNIHKFMKGCCCLKNCQKHFSYDQIRSSVLNMQEMSRDENGQFLMGILSNGFVCTETTKLGNKRQREKRSFAIHGKNVCKSTFMLYYDTKRTVLSNMLKHVTLHGAVPRVHGNKSRRPMHAMQLEDVQRVVHFLKNTDETIGIFYPEAPRGNDRIPVVFLPSHNTKLRIHNDYKQLCINEGVKYLRLTAFKTIWSRCVPHIKIAKLCDDVCAMCESLQTVISNAVTEIEKLDSAAAMTNHVNDARKERELYMERVQLASADPVNTMHITFDFSQSVSILHNSRQMGPLYFLSLLKVMLFGFRVSGGSQINIVYDELQTIG
ncbi:uncharacterized protein LOC127881174 isoform X2 [Dreissena polymorpha]|uniref:uncharacterized protein LOC127881174 isoform X2 n=1 Tax=Dreissena polymorpha TaxID=45954 RepID=UPI0022649F3E|nr:uncharacterized protein LOC127881174 isoform X2 [Dreissena polymorpha]